MFEITRIARKSLLQMMFATHTDIFEGHGRRLLHLFGAFHDVRGAVGSIRGQQQLRDHLQGRAQEVRTRLHLRTR